MGDSHAATDEGHLCESKGALFGNRDIRTLAGGAQGRKRAPLFTKKGTSLWDKKGTLPLKGTVQTRWTVPLDPPMPISYRFLHVKPNIFNAKLRIIAEMNFFSTFCRSVTVFQKKTVTTLVWDKKIQFTETKIYLPVGCSFSEKCKLWHMLIAQVNRQ